MIRIILLSVCMVTTMFAHAVWLEKKDNPEELFVVVAANEDCFVSTEALKDTVHGVLIRSRIKPLTEPDSDSMLTLGVNLDCITSENSNQMFMYTVEYYLPLLGLTVSEAIYSKFGRASKESITNSVKSSVESAMTDYIKVNFIDKKDKNESSQAEALKK